MQVPDGLLLLAAIAKTATTGFLVHGTLNCIERRIVAF